MGYDGTGTYSRQHNWSADASANIKILASRQDQEWDDLASAMNVALLRDGRAAMTGNLVMGGNRVVNVGAPMSATNYMRSKDFIENLPIYMVDAEASADRISVSAEFYTTASAATAPRDGSHILVKMGSDKSSAVAIRLNTGDGNPHSAGVVLANGSAIYSGALRSGGIYEFFWSSTDAVWQLFNPQVDYATSALPGVIQIATSAEVVAGTDVPKAITPAQLAAKFSADQATNTSAGIIELATTAEALDGTDTARAITPAVGAAAYGRSYLLTGRYIFTSGAAASASTLSKNQVASTWTFELSASRLRINYGEVLSSAFGINIQMFAHGPDFVSPVGIGQLSADASGFNFFLNRNDTGSSIMVLSAGNIYIHVLGNKVI